MPFSARQDSITNKEHSLPAIWQSHAKLEANVLVYLVENRTAHHDSLQLSKPAIPLYPHPAHLRAALSQQEHRGALLKQHIAAKRYENCKSQKLFFHGVPRSNHAAALIQSMGEDGCAARGKYSKTKAHNRVCANGWQQPENIHKLSQIQNKHARRH